MVNAEDYADLKIEKIRLEQELEDTNAELDLYKRALELACQFSIAPEQTMQAWLDQAEKEGR